MSGMLGAFIGAIGNRRVTLEDVPSVLDDLVVSPANPNAYLIFGNDGSVSEDYSVGGPSVLGDWLILGVAADYDVNAVVNSGALQVGAAGTFNLGTTRNFGCDRSTDGTNSANVTFNLRKAGSSNNLASKTVTFTVERSV